MIKIYTDGSAYQKLRLGGWGVYVSAPKEILLRGRAKETTISRMEMKAMLEALKLVHNYNEPVEILSDSQMVVNSINKKWLYKWENEGISSRKNHDLWIEILEELRKLNRSRKMFSIRHINGHQKGDSEDVIGNHIADALANYKT